jgi:hypothetical protein
MTLKLRYVLTEIHYASVLVVKIYGQGESKHSRIKLGLSFSPKEDNRLIKLQTIPTDFDSYNAVVETIIGNECRGKQVTDKITDIPNIEEYILILKYINTYCKDQFVLDFIKRPI